MNTQKLLHNFALILFAAAALLFFGFFVYMIFGENVSVTTSDRSPHHYEQVTQYTLKDIPDETAPVGMRREYRWTLDHEDASESCLCFYTVHQFVHVYYDGQLVYSLELQPYNRIGHTPGSNWVTVPVHPEDVGKEVTVVLTPVFKSAAGFVPDFFAGSHYAIAFDVLTRDLPQVFLSTLCMVLGLMIIAVQLYFVFCVHIQSFDLIYLGGFAVLLGLWRITDLRCAPMLFHKNPMALGYITIGSLFLLSIPLLLFFSTFFSRKKAAPLLILSAISSITVMAVLALQLTGAAELRQMLPASHILLIAATVFPVLLAILSKRDKKTSHVSRSWNFSLILLLGILLDMVLYYLTNSSSYIMFALLAFVVYSVIVFVTSIRDTSRKAYADPRTGLANKLRWNDLLHDSAPVADGTVMIMMDLNGLKSINDTYGHEAGDDALLRFSRLLRNIFPSSSLISRWGGDEFAILMQDMVPDKLEKYLAAFSNAVKESNAMHGEPSLHFAVGYAFSAQYPQLNHRELLSKADSLMYENKRQWYAARETKSE